MAIQSHRITLLLQLLLLGALLLSGCASPSRNTTVADDISSNGVSDSSISDSGISDSSSGSSAAPDIRNNSSAHEIRINASGNTRPFDQRLLGSNVPAWLNPARLEDPTLRARTRSSGMTVMRLPGGSWSNYYNWLGCEMRDEQNCYWTWAANPTDFINFLRATDKPALFTVNMNNTPQEAAALVAFFNGAVDDERPIGVDVNGQDWLTVGHWARLRRDHGNPEPFRIELWEVGNEIYGGKPDMGTDCTPWGWEDVWTCDGTEYVNGIGSGDNRKAGFREFRDAMRAVDPSILVGAIGVVKQTDWGNWGNEVIAGAGDEMDFYSIHYYGYEEETTDFADVLTQPQATWFDVMQNINEAFDRHANGRRIPIAVTEYNLFAGMDQDPARMMISAVNALFIADTIGQLGQNGFAIANQWDLANGMAENGTDYGLIHAETYERYPAYYVFSLWERFGTTLLPVTSSLPASTKLSVYAGRIDAHNISLLAINKTGNRLESTIQVDGLAAVTSGSVDTLQAVALDSQEVTLNGVTYPADDLSDAPSRPLNNPGNPFNYTFEPYSVTLIRLHTAPAGMTSGNVQLYLPLTSNS